MDKINVGFNGTHITVGDMADPDGRTYWTPEMWESSVWQPIVDGLLPALASPVDPGIGELVLGRWRVSGVCPVRWNGVEYDAGTWSEFTERVRSGELSAEAITGKAPEQ